MSEKCANCGEETTSITVKFNDEDTEVTKKFCGIDCLINWAIGVEDGSVSIQEGVIE